MFGLWRRRCGTELTRAALSLVQFGHTERAEEILGGAVGLSVQGSLVRALMVVLIVALIVCSLQAHMHASVRSCARCTFCSLQAHHRQQGASMDAWCQSPCWQCWQC